MIRGFILAGAKCQADYYIKANFLDPMLFKNLTSIEQLEGYINPIIIKVGTYYLNPIYFKVRRWEKNRNV